MSDERTSPAAPTFEIAVIVNPGARYHARRPDVARRMRELIRPGEGVLYETEDLYQLEAAAAEIAAAPPGVVAVSGGDGTTGLTLSALRRAFDGRPLPIVALLRGGTMNTVARGMGLKRGRPLSLLTDLLAVARSADPPATARFASILARDRVVFLLGTGVIHGYLTEYYRDGDPTHLSAAGVLGKLACSTVVGGALAQRLVAGITARLRVDDDWHASRRYLFVGATTVPEMGLGFAPFHRTGPGMEGFHVLAFAGGPGRLVSRLPSFWMGRSLPEPLGLDLLATREFVIESDDGRVEYMADGELLEVEGPLHVTRGPSMNVWTP